MIEYLWHKGPDFDKDGTAVPLIFRIATVEDKKEITANHRTRCQLARFCLPWQAAEVVQTQYVQHHDVEGLHCKQASLGKE